MKRAALVVVAILALAVSGCAGSAEDVCTMAARHLERCSGILLQMPVANCDADKASRVLEIDCDRLAADGARGAFYNDRGSFDDLLGMVGGMSGLSDPFGGGTDPFDNTSGTSGGGSSSGKPLKCGLHEKQCYCIYDAYSGPQLAPDSACSQQSQKSVCKALTTQQGTQCYCVTDNVSSPQKAAPSACGLSSAADGGVPPSQTGQTGSAQAPLQCGWQGNQCYCVYDEYSGPKAAPSTECYKFESGSSSSSDKPVKCQKVKDRCLCIYVDGQVKAAPSESYCGTLAQP
jgi:hypothetical protein